MKIIKLKGARQESEIFLKHGILKEAGVFCLKDANPESVCIMTDSNVSPLYLETLENSFPPDVDILSLNIPAGEAYKHLLTVEEIYKVMAESNFKRGGMIVALGGGVIGDIAGFVAATYMRGVKHLIQIPTTLLAQVDSSVGGKCGVDLPQGKNMVGAFRQPDRVLVDVSLLGSLNKETFMSGMAEVIKYGVIKDKGILEAVEKRDFYENIIVGKDTAELEELIKECIVIKRDIVERDEFDDGERKLLNFGHTVGHALEKIGEYRNHSHGEAVAMGMAAALDIGEHLNKTKKGTAEYIRGLLKKHSLPTELCYPAESICSAIKFDKKAEESGISIISIDEIGKARVILADFDEIFTNIYWLAEKE